MEQGSRARVHLERILLVCGEPNAGKSRLIRHMFQDRRLGGEIPTNGPLPRYALSRERYLAGRIMSPHEANETPGQFHQKIDQASAGAGSDFRRMNYVSAIQPRPRNKMPGVVAVCQGLQNEFRPERMRVVQLAPDQGGRQTSRLSEVEVDGLRSMSRC
jgi:hypothetical protein